MAAPRLALRVAQRASLATLVVLVLCASAGGASAWAACPSLDASRLAGAQRALASAAPGPAATDAAAIVVAARRRCSTARFAYAAALATRQTPQPAVGARARIAGVDLVAAHLGDGAAWRLDVERAAARVGRAGSERAAAVQRSWTFPAAAGASTTWSLDPTRPSWDPQLQARVVGLLARSRRSSDRALATSGARAFAPARRRASAARLGLLEHLDVAARVAMGARDAASVRAARALASGALRRVNATPRDGWSWIDGRWSTNAEHRAIVTRTRGLLRRYPVASTAKVVQRLAASLASPSDVRFRALPSGEFYPWPRDGALDEQQVTVHVDRPGTLRLVLYGEAPDPVRVLEQAAQPGDVVVGWDGAATDGTILGPGEYLYAVELVDPTGRTTRAPGLQPFRIAKDTTPPLVRATSVQLLTSGSAGPRLLVSWDVDEPLSPVVRTQLVLERAGRRITVLLDDQRAQHAVSRELRLGRGTWTTEFAFTDGSGNVTRAAGRSLVVG